MKHAVILIPFHNPWTWHTDYTNQTAIQLSRTHTVVCLLWGDAVSLWEIMRGLRYAPLQREGNLWKVRPLYIIPGKRFFLTQLVTLFFSGLLISACVSLYAMWTRRERLFWFFGYYDPAFLLLPPLFARWRTIYDCVDIATHPVPRLSDRIERAERRLVQRAWVVVVNSRTLHARMRRIRKDIHVVPLGFRMEMFDRPIPYKPLRKGRRPFIGYFGSIDYRLDLPLLFDIAEKHRNWQFGLFGPIFYDHLTQGVTHTLKKLLALPNVVYDCVDTRAVPSVLAQCDVTIIPFSVRMPISRFSFPMKVMEYFFAGKPVVSSRITELARYPDLIRFADDAPGWSAQLTDALKHPYSARQKARARRIAVQNAWTQKIRAILAVIRKRTMEDRYPDLP